MTIAIQKTYLSCSSLAETRLCLPTQARDFQVYEYKVMKMHRAGEKRKVQGPSHPARGLQCGLICRLIRPMPIAKGYFFWFMLSLLVLSVYLLLRVPSSSSDLGSVELTSTSVIPQLSIASREFFHAEAKEYTIFAHVPKTSGTSLRTVLLEVAKIRSWKIQDFYQQADHQDIPNSNNFARVLYGHLVNRILGKLEGRNYTFAMVRKPLERAISTYKHQLRDAFGAGVKNVTFASFFTGENVHQYCNQHWITIFGKHWQENSQQVSEDEIQSVLQRATSEYLLLLPYSKRNDSFAALARFLHKKGTDPSKVLPFDPCLKANLHRNSGIKEESLSDDAEKTHISLEHLRELESCNRLDFALFLHAELQFGKIMKEFRYSCKPLPPTNAIRRNKVPV